MKIRVLEIEPYLTEVVTRLPFRFGVVTLREGSLCTLRVGVETESGARATGFSADLLVPKWFDKDPGKSLEEDARDLLESLRLATAAYTARDLPALAPFDLWWRVYRERVEHRPPDASDRLVRGFGVALVERAVLDAVCRAEGVSFFAALKDDLFGFRPGEVHRELDGWDLAASLPARPLDSVSVRHTVGLVDALRAADIAAADRVGDGLPEALEEDIETYGLDVFKVKLSGDREQDLARLVEISRVLEERVPGKATLTVDGNEQFTDLADLVALFEAVRETEDGRRLLEGLMYVEQPLSRSVSFDPERTAAMDALREWAPVILDESDSGIGAFPRAVALGYEGISVKNCKGVFRSLLNRGLCDTSDRDLFQSAEDLTNLPVLALQQDLATVAALGLTHVERNGHHYFRGLDHLPRSEAESALAAHPGLYRELNDSIVLDIRGGRLDLQSLDRPGYGYDVEVAVDGRRAVGGEVG